MLEHSNHDFVYVMPLIFVNQEKGKTDTYSKRWIKCRKVPVSLYTTDRKYLRA